MIERPSTIARVKVCFRSHPCVAILGPRQCGKTTLARMIAADEPSISFFDLESPIDARRLSVPLRTLGSLEGLVVLDEVQRRPELFEILVESWWTGRSRRPGSCSWAALRRPW